MPRRTAFRLCQMIVWLVQSTSEHPDLAGGRAPVGLLSAREHERLASLRTPKRQHDWLLGRWTAKQLVKSYVEQTAGVTIALADIDINNNRDGVPLVTVAPDGSVSGEVVARIPPLALSISHCEEFALCALAAAPPQAVGADIERIRPRARNFVTDYFTPAEIDQVDGAPAGLKDTIVTAIWSSKEAALKAVQLGLSVDTRRVECQLAATAAHDRWQPLVVTYWPYPDASGAVSGRRLVGSWCTLDVYVLTIVVTEEMRSLPEWISDIA